MTTIIKKNRFAVRAALLLSISTLPASAAFSFPPIFSAATISRTAPVTTPQETRTPLPISVAVAGATGRTGQLVVNELLSRGVNVVALVRNMEKAGSTFPDENTSLSVVKCDLGSKKDIFSAAKGCDAAVWCATGFSDAPGTSALAKIQGFFGVFFPQQSIDSIGIPALAGSVLSGDDDKTPGLPKVVMLSSAGVTRPSWTEEKKERYSGAADIPIVRLNPFGILDAKAASEEKLRRTGVDYCIVRPCGLNENWPTKSRPIFSQGDVSVGRINRGDVATILVDVLTTPEATGKTFEVVTLAGYAPPVNLSVTLSRLKTDEEGITDEELAIAYTQMQQLLPGERQDAAALAMGQTYEELDQGVTGRLGERGTEDAQAAAPKPT